MVKWRNSGIIKRGKKILKQFAFKVRVLSCSGIMSRLKITFSFLILTLGKHFAYKHALPIAERFCGWIMIVRATSRCILSQQLLSACCFSVQFGPNTIANQQRIVIWHYEGHGNATCHELSCLEAGHRPLWWFVRFDKICPCPTSRSHLFLQLFDNIYRACNADQS